MSPERCSPRFTFQDSGFDEQALRERGDDNRKVRGKDRRGVIARLLARRDGQRMCSDTSGQRSSRSNRLRIPVHPDPRVAQDGRRTIRVCERYEGVHRAHRMPAET
jgi:hypothetical protein